MQERTELEARLHGLTADIVAETKQDKEALAELEKELVRSAIVATPKGPLRREWSLDRSDRLDPRRLPRERRLRVKRLVERTEVDKPASHRVFRRESPVATGAFDLSAPAWGRGAAIDKTHGPFVNQDGRTYWFDFYRHAELEALYFAGQTRPALLFHVRQAQRRTRNRLPLTPVGRGSNKQQLRLNAGSLWIRADLLAKGAPGDGYVGLKIKGGRLLLDDRPQDNKGKLTLPKDAAVAAGLKLDPADPPDEGRSRTGGDAAAAQLDLPDSIELLLKAGSLAPMKVDRAAWSLYGQKLGFKAAEKTKAEYREALQALVVPMETSSDTFKVGRSRSKAAALSGSAKITGAGWVLPVAAIDIDNPTEAAGAGGLTIQGNSDLEITWPGLRDGPICLPSPGILLFPGILIVSDLAASNRYARQTFRLWQDEDSAFRSEVLLRYTDSFPLLFVASAAGNELILAETNAEGRFDRPVDVAGSPFPVNTLGSLLLLWFSDTASFVALFDDDILVDALDPQQTWPVAPGEAISLAIRNALFTITPVNGLFLFARLRDEEMVETGTLLLAFGLYGVLPTLPDPYAANTRWLRNQIRDGQRLGRPGILLLSGVSWQKAASDEDPDSVDVTFAFAPLGDQEEAFEIWSDAGEQAGQRGTPFGGGGDFQGSENLSIAAAAPTAAAAAAPGQKPNEPDWDRQFERFYEEQFALLDVSSNADQMGVSFAWFSPTSLEDEDYIFYQVYLPSSQENPDAGTFPFQIEDLDLSAQSRFVRGFALPQVSWEPLFNLTPPAIAGDPPPFFNFYPNDGGPTRLFNDAVELVPVAPIPVTEFLVEDFDNRAEGFTGALFTLPFGLKAFAEFSRDNQFQPNNLPGARLRFNRPEYDLTEVEGGLQLRADAPEHPQEGSIFRGSTLQLNNVVTAAGLPTGAGTLGNSVGFIFNEEFFYDGNTGYKDRGVPLERIDFSGYGASTFSHWLNPNAAIAATSQARFDIFVGRCSHEVIQVRSLVYPWGIKVVRTITIFRVSSSYVYRFDSGWQAESDGLYDFRYRAYDNAFNPVDIPSPYEFHPGLVRGLFRIRNIVETNDVPVFEATWSKQNGDPYIDDNGVLRTVNAATPADERNPAARLQPLYFDADVEIDSVVSGAKGGRVPSKRMLGYVQLAPRGEPLPPSLFAQLLNLQFGSLGGPVDCVVDLAQSGQQMRLTRVDVSASSDAGGQPIFVSAGRGSVVLPKEGAWSVVQHNQGTGEVTPLADTDSVPAIRRGRLLNPDQQTTDAGQADLTRLANPRELVRAADNATRNFGLLQSTGTQKALFRLPSFETGSNQLLSAAPDFADAYRLLNAELFPTIADTLPMALGNFETRILEQGYQLLNQADPTEVFEQILPDGPLYLINEEFLKIYVEYAKKDKDGNKTQDGSLRYGFDALAADQSQKWLSKVNDIGMVVDLGPLERLMMVKGKFDTEKGASPAFIEPQLEFSDALQPVIDILQILLMLQGGDYEQAFAKGLEIAMSNSADSWTYAFSAKKEIPLVKFPPGPAFDNPTNPLKLECKLALGVYFNEVLDFTDDPKDLIPSAGAFIEFGGRLSVMCVSVAAATVYATGSVDLRTAADIKTGPSLLMKFGFGAEIVVGLPVVGTVSILYMVGVEIILETDRMVVAGFLLFRGRAEILGGIVTVTITIEAKGIIERLPAQDRTNMIAQVTFGLDISIFLVINISFSESWQEARQIA